MAFAHDSTRVIQCFIRYGNDKQRQETFEELKGIFPFYIVFALEVGTVLYNVALLNVLLSSQNSIGTHV